MEKEIIQNSNFHFEHQIWQSELDFWEDELKAIKNRLSELVTRWTAKAVLEKLEHFQNAFIIHGGVVEDLREAFEKQGAKITDHHMMGEFAFDSATLKRHLELRNKIEAQRQIYADLKQEFFRFLSAYM